MREGQPPEAQKAIDELLVKFNDAKQGAKAQAPPRAEPANPFPRPLEQVPDVDLQIEDAPPPVPPPVPEG